MKNSQRGATIVEFALGLLLFLMFLFGILDFSRMLFTWNAASEAARAGVRYAVVCDSTADAAAVLSRMQAMLPQISSISVAWTPSGCDPSTCVGAAVTITGLDYQWISPLPGVTLSAFTMPTFSTFLTRESMRQDPNSGTICP